MTLFNLLIVDDEEIMLDFLVNMIDWGTSEISQPLYAYNGKQAMEIIRSQKIHIVITDIKMPIMNGIELMEQALSVDPEIKFIILSGYDDYAYLRTAYKLGAVDYFLKSTMSQAQLKTAVDDVISLLKTKTKTKTFDIDNISVKADTDRRKYINRILSEHLSSGKVLSNHEIFFADSNCRLLVVKLFTSKQYMSKEWSNNFELFSYAMINIFTELLESYGNHEICMYSYDTAVLFLDPDADFEAIFSLISSTLCSYLGINSCGCTYPKTVKLSQIKPAFEHTCELLQQYFFFGKNTFIHTENIPCGETVEFSSTSRISILRNALAGFNIYGIFQTLENLTIDNKNYNISKVRRLFDQYAYELEYFCNKNNIYTNFEELFMDYYDTLRENGDLNELNQWLKKIIFEIVEHMQNFTDLAMLVKNYIDEHYAEDISLDLLEKTFFASKWHISRCFHEKTGVSLVKYITNYRIQKATELLITTDLMVNNIAEKVGYTNIEHFSRSFKKIIGTSPLAFRKEHDDTK